MLRRIISQASLLATLFCSGQVSAQSAPGADPSANPSANPGSAQSIEDEVLVNLKAQPVDDVQTLEDYQLPDAYLRVLADRVIRSSFEGQFRIVVRDGSSGSSATGGSGDANAQPSSRFRAVRWLGLIILIPVAIAGWVLLGRRKEASR